MARAAARNRRGSRVRGTLMGYAKPVRGDGSGSRGRRRKGSFDRKADKAAEAARAQKLRNARRRKLRVRKGKRGLDPKPPGSIPDGYATWTEFRKANPDKARAAKKRAFKRYVKRRRETEPGWGKSASSRERWNAMTSEAQAKLKRKQAKQRAAKTAGDVGASEAR